MEVSPYFTVFQILGQKDANKQFNDKGMWLLETVAFLALIHFCY